MASTAPARSPTAASSSSPADGSLRRWAEEDGGAAMAEARSLDAFRSALENLEDQLEFVHVIKSQQRADRDATTMRLGQSCNILARRLAEDEGKKYVAIEMAS
ncbi:hypothetical protein B296_00022619 [Ensete ventricosum]|uniref:Uncharacterized protein n=1 Tax=Ensete ventricosum TaxID=4639 RepID=A0A426XEM9_ENSVE|nr:hypothetical protein B296_00022619 [Ensete ventricosum]